MVLGVLGYAGQAAQGMDESARMRRTREEEEMRLAQQRRTEADAQRQAALQGFARQQQVGLMQGMDLGEAPEMRAGQTLTAASTPPQAGLTPPAAAAPPAAQPEELAAPTTPAPTQAEERRGAPSLQAGLRRQADALEAQAATAMTPEQIDEQLRGYRAGLKKLPSSRATKPRRDDIIAEIKRLEAMKKEQAGTPAPAAATTTTAADTAPVSTQAVADSLGTSPDAPEAQAITQAAEAINQTRQQVVQETSPVMYSAQDPSFAQQIPQAVQQGMDTRGQLANMYTRALDAGYPELAAQYYQQISDIDATLVGMYQTQALTNLERMGDPAALAGELERSLGVPVTIARKGNKFEVSYDDKKRDYTLEQLREDAKLQFDADYKAALMKSRSEQSMEAFRSQLRMSEEQVKSLLAGQLESMKPFNIGIGDGRQVGVFRTPNGVFVLGYGEQKLEGFDGNETIVEMPFLKQATPPAAGLTR